MTDIFNFIKQNFIFIVVSTTFVLLTYQFGRISGFRYANEKMKERIDTVKTTDIMCYVDTLVKKVPIFIDKYNIKYQEIHDTIRTPDNKLIIPIEQKVYKDSDYLAYVSGYEPNLDSIRLYRKNTVIKEKMTITETKYKTKKWSLQLGVGYGYNPIQKTHNPMVGITVGYNLLGW